MFKYAIGALNKGCWAPRGAHRGYLTLGVKILNLEGHCNLYRWD